MAQNRFVLLHRDGQFLSINDGSHWIGVEDRAAATVLTETKANNILQNMIKPKERENWRIELADLPAEAGKPTVEDIPQEEVPDLEPPAPPKKATRQRKKQVAPPSAEEAPPPAEAQPAASPAAEPPAPPPQPEVAPAAKKKGKKAQAAKVVPAKAHSTPPAPEEPPKNLINEWVERAGEMKKEYDRLIQRKKDLAEQLRQVSAELCDLEHYIEFHSLNAVKGYRMYRRLRDCLIRRRKIKDELMCITIFLKAEPHNIINGNLIRQFSGLLTREYAPRVLQDLFDEMDSESSAKAGK